MSIVVKFNLTVAEDWNLYNVRHFDNFNPLVNVDYTIGYILCKEKRCYLCLEDSAVHDENEIPPKWVVCFGGLSQNQHIIYILQNQTKQNIGKKGERKSA